MNHHHHHHSRTQRGMTLLETLIVVAIAAAVIGGIVFMMQRQSERARNEQVIRTQGQEMANLATAVRQHVAIVGDDWEIGRHEISIDGLVDAGLLPEGFGARDSDVVLGVTPIGQSYRVFSIKDGGAYDDPAVEDGTIRTVILDLGDPNAGRLERAGVPNVPERVLAFKEAVALYASEDRIPMGVVPAGEEVARGVGRVFTKDVLDWLENPPVHGAVVALVGFPDLDGSDSNPTPPGGGGTEYADCTVVRAVDGCSFPSDSCRDWTAPSCPAGYDDLGHPRECGGGGTTAASSPVGMVVSGLRSEHIQSGPDWPGTCAYSASRTTYGDVALSGSVVHSEVCSSSLTSSQWVQVGTEQVCQQSTTGGAHAVTGKPDAHAVLCCLPRE